jgi:signal transduction histidine kinase
LEQVITNLVSNAIKFSPAHSEVTVGISSDHKGICCSVSDQGSGIKEEDLDRIFGKFQQASMPLRGASTGLGLAITRALVMEHGGKIWAESLGQGSRFVFWLPLTGPPTR